MIHNDEAGDLPVAPDVPITSDSTIGVLLKHLEFAGHAAEIGEHEEARRHWQAALAACPDQIKGAFLLADSRFIASGH